MKRTIPGIALLLLGCIWPAEEIADEFHSTNVILVGEELIAEYYDNYDKTQERKELERQTTMAISRYFNRSKEELTINNFCILGREKITIDVIVDNVTYTFSFSMTVEFMTVKRRSR